MAVLCPKPGSSEPHLQCLALACGESVLIGCVNQEQSSADEAPPTSAVTTSSMSCGSSPLVCLAFSPSGHLLAACNDDKALTVWKTGAGGWVLLPVGDRAVPKRATALQFTSDDNFILVADKTGEVTRYKVSNIAEEGEAILGHFSMVLDMTLSPGNSHVITCDRDEKIRVSNYPNSYNIETFCLGHTDFVSVLCFCERWPNLLMSGSGDGTVRVWEWLKGQLLHTEVCSQAEQEKDPLAVVQLTCTHKAENPLVVVAMESSPQLHCFQLHRDGRLIQCPESSTIVLTAPPWSCAFDWSDYLWVCLPDEQEPLVCYKPEGVKFRKLQHREHPLLASLCNWEHFKGCTGNVRDYSQLRKRLFDNMSAYLTRKEERLKTREAQKLLETESEREESRPRAPKTAKVEEETVASGLPQQTEL